jgi:hypothetical protein
MWNERKIFAKFQKREGAVANRFSPKSMFKNSDWSKMPPFRPCCVPKMLVMRCITPLLAPCLDKNVLIFACNLEFKHSLYSFWCNLKGYDHSSAVGD